MQQGFATWWVAALLLLFYEGMVVLGATVASVAQQVVRRRVEQIVDVANLAMGRRVSRYAHCYRRYVLERDGHINARDLAHTPSHIPELDAVYVDVGLAPGSPSNRASGLLPFSSIEQLQRHSIHDFLDKEKPIVCAVIGAPGSGKSTLLRHTARLGANQGRKRRRRVPVMLALRDHAEALASDPSLPLAELIRNDVGKLEIKEPAGWWEAQLRGGACLVLFDGLDEVARSEDRAAVAEWIEKQIAKQPNNDFVITSRPHGYQTAVIPQATVLQVRPFTTEQIGKFVHSWCRAAERLATGSSGSEIDHRAHEEADDLLGQLFANSALMELAVNPLLLTMMVLVHRERRSLPAGRADLYHQVCDVMLWRRQKSKKLEVRPPGPVRQRILGALAYEMMTERVPDFSKRQVLEVFEQRLRQIDTDITAEDLLTEIVESSGLLVEREKDLYAFAHHTIGEYLASTHIRSNALVGSLVREVGDPWWRETTLLYVTDSDADAIVQACLDRNTGAALALAFDCLRSAGHLDRTLRDHLDRFLRDAFEDDAAPEHRRLVASALAAGHLNRLVTAENGMLICPHPVPEDLYWLFCKDTDMPFPEGVDEYKPGRTQPAAGMRARDSEFFVHWLNTVVFQGNPTSYRLPAVSEITSLTNEAPITSQPILFGSPIWTRSVHSRPLILWMPTHTNPYAVTSNDLNRAVAADFFKTSLFMELILFSIHLDARRVSLPSRKFLTADIAPSASKAIDLFWHHQLPVALFRDVELTWDMARSPLRNFKLPPDFDMRSIRAWAHVLQSERRGDVVIAQQYPPRGLIETLAFTPQRIPEWIIDYPKNDLLHQVISMKARDRIRNKVIGRALTLALSRFEQMDTPSLHSDIAGREAIETFTTAFIEQTGIHRDFHAAVDLDALSDKLKKACAAFDGPDMRKHTACWTVAFALRLFEEAHPVLQRRRSISSVNIADLRVPALLLAAEAEAAGLPETAEDFRYVAAGFTLLEKRAAGEAPLETLLLALM